jgi:Tfp pilus assembly protein PilV
VSVLLIGITILAIWALIRRLESNRAAWRDANTQAQK